MKTMSCKQLGGGCDMEFQADTFEEIADLVKQHRKHMYQRRDIAHLDAMANMLDLKKDPAKMDAWFAEKQKEFDALPES